MITTDDFIEAARAEAERRFDFLSDASCFEQGAEWARTHLAQQNPLTEAIRAVATTTTLTGQDVAGIAQSLQRITQGPTDAEVEAAAVAICSGEGGCDPCFNWDDSVAGGCTYCTRHARAALSAARAARRDGGTR